jgi:hypothetical protein
MSDATADAITVESLAEEFLERKRRGEQPTVAEYVARYPHLADEIREVFPVLGLVEDFKPGSGDATGTFGGAEIPAWSSGSNAWATTGCSAKLVAVAWGWFTRPSRNRWAVAWR